MGSGFSASAAFTAACGTESTATAVARGVSAGGTLVTVETAGGDAEATGVGVEVALAAAAVGDADGDADGGGGDEDAHGATLRAGPAQQKPRARPQRGCARVPPKEERVPEGPVLDRKSTRLNSSH